jgi:aromatic-L-amino-acid decarboxylase
VIDYRDWQIPLGRRFRALKLWMVIRSYGVCGLQALIRKHVALARRFAEWVAVSQDFELAAPVPLNLVCFRHRGGEAINQRILERLNASGERYLTHTKLDGRLTLRMCVAQTRTEECHVRSAWDALQAAARDSGGPY